MNTELLDNEAAKEHRDPARVSAANFNVAEADATTMEEGTVRMRM